MNVSLPIEVSGFEPDSPWHHLNGEHLETFGWQHVLRAAIVAGYAREADIPSPQYKRWRLAGLRVGLRTARRRLILPPEWQSLDPSEKGTIRSVLGVIVTKLLLERLMNAPLLFFLDVHFHLVFSPHLPHLRPDFVALSPDGEWFSVEAKGRERFVAATMRKGKSQARSLGLVNGKRVGATICCVTGFRQGILEVAFADPEPDPDKQTKAEVDVLEALNSYYHPLFSLREISKTVEPFYDLNNQKVSLWELPELDLKFGLHPKLESTLQSSSPKEAISVLRKIHAESPLTMDDSKSFLGPDGVWVIPGKSWD